MSPFIKFRVWDTKLSILFPWNPFIRFDDPEYKIIQFTGFIDCHNKDIFVGDIIRCKNGVFQVIISRGAFCVRKVENQIGDYGSLFFHYTASVVDAANTCEIIGNVYENPELLKHE